MVVTGRGFPNDIPEELRPWAETHRLVRAAAVLALLGSALVCLSGHWVRGALARWICRVVGLILAGIAIWLAAGWFSGEMPEEVRPWTAKVVIERSVIVLALLCLAAAFWVRERWGTPHARWANRSLAPAAAAFAVVLAWRWFGTAFDARIEDLPVVRVTIVLAAIATGVCLLIAGGAFLLRERPAVKRTVEQKTWTPTPVPAAQQLPIATLLDDRGRPVLPRNAAGHSGPAGA